jgi:4-hydroxy-tetrahydrodipicolinate reductase
MVRLVVVGAAGRMGQEVIKLLDSHDDMKAAFTVDPHGRTSAQTIDDVDPQQCDGVIDFSSPKATMNVARWCAKHRKFLVSGTTGLSRQQQAALKKLGRRMALLWAPNLSLGIAAMKQALKGFGGLEGFDFQIEEFHHKHKKDRPSGTAVALQNALSEAAGRRLPEPISIRGGDVRGIHRIWALGEGEVLCLEHVALDRAIFARGSITAAEWLSNQRPGVYSIEDLWQEKRRKR